MKKENTTEKFEKNLDAVVKVPCTFLDPIAKAKNFETDFYISGGSQNYDILVLEVKADNKTVFSIGFEPEKEPKDKSLTEEEKEFLYWRYIKELSYIEIAKKFYMPIKEVCNMSKAIKEKF